MPEPETMTSAPARKTRSMMSALIPPSASTRIGSLRSWISFRTCLIFGSRSGMNAWPPKPGKTVIIKIMSMSGKQRSTFSRGTSGFTATEVFAPGARIFFSVAMGSLHVSGCMETQFAGFDEFRRIIVRVGDHQMNIQRNIRDLAHPLHHDGTNGEIGHKMSVHDIDMQPVCAGRLDGLNLVFQAAEVRR